MVRTPLIALLCGCLLAAPSSHGQEVFVPTQKTKPKPPTAQPVQASAAKAEKPIEKAAAAQLVKPPVAVAVKLPAAAVPPPSKSEPAKSGQPNISTAAAKTDSIASSKSPTNTSAPNAGTPTKAKTPSVVMKVARTIAGTSPVSPAVPSAPKPAVASSKTVSPAVAEKSEASPSEKKASATTVTAAAHEPSKKIASAAVNPLVPVAKAKAAAPASKIPAKVEVVQAKPTAAAALSPKLPTPTTQTMALQTTVPESSIIQAANGGQFDTAFTKLSDGFDFPVGKPDAQGYYKARGFRSHGHMGEDWDGVGGGDTDLGDPIYSIGNGIVVFARDCHMGWGNVVIVRHSYREGSTVKTIDALYGHLNSMLVRRGQTVARGQQIATMGTAHGLYDAHLHLEIRKNIEIGMSRAAFAQDFSNYYDPSAFIQTHRHLQAGGGNYRVAMNTFTRDARIRWDKVRNYSHAHTGGGSSQSAAALKKALASKKSD